MSRDEASADQRRRILRATAELVAKRGFQGTTSELIVRRARVGYATFYKHFADKEECLLALFEEVSGRIEARLWEVYEQEPGAWPQKVAAVLRALFALIAADPVVAKACLVETLSAGPAAVAAYEAALKSLAPMLRPGRELNPRGDKLPATLEDTIAGGVLWVAYQRLIVGEAGELEQCLPETIEFVLTPYLGEEEAVRVAAGELSSAGPA
ncbi:MAG TPA: TetR/AcrR family transcriptional regulator [Solirubrobacterales bacterium]|nr:TetR/AcrR family transcriptional regulator [Solirubrobacterales bacterium]